MEKQPTPRNADGSETVVEADEPTNDPEPGDHPDLLERVAEVVGDLFDDDGDPGT